MTNELSSLAKNKAALDAYQKHPAHLKAAKEVLVPHASEVKVYDIEVKG